jgi:hypothetical protein
MSCNNYYETLGTHDVVNSTVFVTETGITITSAAYSEHSTASGVLYNFVYISVKGGVDFSRSALLALDRNSSYNHTLPFNLYPGHYRVYVYDIEHDRTLSNGVGFPAKEIHYVAGQSHHRSKQVYISKADM